VQRVVKRSHRLGRVVTPATATPEPSEEDRRHLHVKLNDPRGSVLDLITEYLQAAGKAPDWYWRLAGRLEGSDPENVDDLVNSAFEAGAFVAHEHPEDLKFEWVSEQECEKERKAEEKGQQGEDSRRERGSMSHYA
jgi:hypothetical protein